MMLIEAPQDGHWRGTTTAVAVVFRGLPLAMHEKIVDRSEDALLRQGRIPGVRCVGDLLD
jgi:hypothetical protein